MKRLFFVILTGIICSLFTLLLYSGTLCPKVNAAECSEDDSGQLDILASSGNAGDIIQAGVRIQSAPDAISALGFQVIYDASVLEYKSFTRGDLTASFDMFSVGQPAAGRLKVGGFIAANPIPQGASGSVIVLSFTVKDGAEDGCYSLRLENLTDNLRQFSASQGCFCMADTTPPVLTCPESRVVYMTEPYGVSAADPEVLAFLSEAAATDNSDGEVAVNSDSPRIFPEGTNTITFTAQDSSGNTSTCTASITVQRPVCSEDSSGNLDIQGAQGALGDEIQVPVIIQNAPNSVSSLGFELHYNPAVLEYSGASSTRGELTTSFTMFNVSNPSSGRIKVGGFTAGDPIPQGAGGILVSLGFTVIGGIDNGCYPLIPKGMTDDFKTFSASPGCFCSTDTIPPELTCPENRTVEQTDPDGAHVTDPDVLAFLAEARGMDNSDGEVAVSNDAPEILPPGTNIITFTGQDRSGNIASCAASITVQRPECTEDDSGELDISQAQGRAGDTIQIPVMIQNAPNPISALGLEVNFNPSVLAYSGVFTRGELTTSFTMLNVSNPSSGRLKIGGFATGDPIYQGASGCIVMLDFTVTGGIEGGCYPLTAKNPTDDIRQCSLSHGCFCINSCNGDLNGDGMVSPGDAFAVFQCYLDPDTCPDCADVNQDGTVSPVDALCIFKHFLGVASCLD